MENSNTKALAENGKDEKSQTAGDRKIIGTVGGKPIYEDQCAGAYAPPK